LELTADQQDEVSVYAQYLQAVLSSELSIEDEEEEDDEDHINVLCFLPR